MRKLLCGAWLLGVAFGLIGCSSARSPHLVIAPSYSYVQADLARGVESSPIADASSDQRVAVKLPPMPAAPGFDTLVFAGSGTQAD